MKMQGRRLFVELTVAIFVTACLGFATSETHKPSRRETTVTFATTTMFKNGTTLPAGNYRMEVSQSSTTSEVKFYKEHNSRVDSQYVPEDLGGGKFMASVPAEVVAQSKKNAATKIESVTRGNAQLVTTIRPVGWDEEIVFGQSGKDRSTAKRN